jgi:peroxiredoxin
MIREKSSDKFPLLSPIPAFALRNVDGAMISQNFFQGAKASLVFFSCNHCPYVKGSEDLLVRLVREFEPKGLRTVAINSNDAQKYPDDSFEMMQQKAKIAALPYPYLHDESQEVARSFDAACTPEFYLFNAAGKLCYHGTINDSPKDASKVSKQHLRTALEQLFSGAEVSPGYVHPLGCSIKWK